MTDSTTQSQVAGRQPGGYLLTASLVLSVLISVAADFNTSHLFNPDWPPHAKFHDVAMLNLLIGSAGVGLWVLWRKSLEPDIAARIAGLIPIIFWTAFFWAPWVVPGVSLVAIEGQPPPQVAGVTVLPNAVAAFIFVLMSVAGLWRRGRWSRNRRSNA